VCYIFFLCLLYYRFYLLFSEDLTVVRILEIKKFSRKQYDISSSREFPYNSVTWRFLLMYFLFKVSGSFLIFNSCVCLLYCSSWRLIILGLSSLLFLGYLTPSCERFLNYFKEGKKHFIV
jgi:hypothetical protein